MTLSLSHEVLRLALRDPFLIARSDHDAGHAVTTVVIELRDERFPGVVGLGEGYPDRFYGETVETMAAVLPLLAAAIEGFEPTAAGLRAAGDRLASAIRWNGGAKCAIDPCAPMIGFGLPVEPDVNEMYAMSSGPTVTFVSLAG